MFCSHIYDYDEEDQKGHIFLLSFIFVLFLYDFVYFYNI